MESELGSLLRTAAVTGNVAALENLLKTAPVSDGYVQGLIIEASNKPSGPSVPVVELLFRKFPSVPLDEGTLRASIYTGSIALFAAILGKDPSVVTRQLDMRGTVFTIACSSRQPIEYLRFLLESGADPNQDPDANAFPLALVAAFYPDTEAIDLLLKYGARMEHSGALSAAVQLGKQRNLRHLLQLGAKPENDAVKVGEYQTPLHVAARKGDIGCLRILLDHGASVDALNSRGQTAREVTEEMEHKGDDRSGVVEVLIEALNERMINR